MLSYSRLCSRGRQVTVGWRRGLSPRQFLVLAFLIGGVLPFAVRDTRPDPELWWHLRTGQYILETRSVPREELFSLASPGRRWVDHEWGLEAPAFMVFRRGGFAALALCSGLAAAATGLVLVVLIYRLTGRLLVALAGTGCVTAGMAPNLVPWPSALTSLLFALLLLLLIRARADRRAAHALWVTPLMFVVWANCHEAFVIGLLLLGIHWLAEEWEAAVVTGGPTPTHVRILRLVLPLSVAACCVNPYGYRALTAALAHINTPPLQRVVAEWQPPDLLNPGHRAAMMGGLLLLIGGLGFSPGRRRPADIWPALLVTFLALSSRRHIPLFLTGIVPAAAVPLARLLREVTALPARAPVLRDLWASPLAQRASYTLQQVGGHRSPAYWLPLAALCGWALFGALPPSRPAEAGVFPARAADFLAAREPRGNMLNPSDWSGYLSYRLWPRCRVFIDGRFPTLYPESTLGDYRTLSEAGPGWEALAERYDLRLLVCSSSQRGLREQAARSPRWREIYRDNQVRIFQRLDVAARAPT